ncbi:MAG: hypothetical protein IJL19_03410 [Clostridiales bacterium]|nr:hypothetical protein [Clostridiales bacterium]
MLYAPRTFYVNELKAIFKENLHDKSGWGDPWEILAVIGEPHCGKTSLVLKAYENRGDLCYFSFKGLSENIVCKKFAERVERYIGIKAAGSDWSDIFETMKHLPSWHYKIFILDDIQETENCQGFVEAFEEFRFAPDRDNIFICLVGERLPSGITKSVYPYQVHHLSLSDVHKMLPKMDPQDSLLVSTATGGIPELVRLFSDYDGFNEAAQDLICIDSPLMNYMPHLMDYYYRKSDIYNELLAEIGRGNTRVSEIGAATGYAYNKCEKYLRSLVDTKILDHYGKCYQFRNTYMQLYYSFLYREEMRLARPKQFPDITSDYVKDVTTIAESEYERACHLHALNTDYGLGSMLTGNRKNGIRPSDVIEKGFVYHFESIIPYDGKMLFVKIVRDTDRRFDRSDLDKIEYAAKKFAPLYESIINVYVRCRPADYCERYAAKYPHIRFHEYDRLKWRDW